MMSRSRSDRCSGSREKSSSRECGEASARGWAGPAGFEPTFSAVGVGEIDATSAGLALADGPGGRFWGDGKGADCRVVFSGVSARNVDCSKLLLGGG